MILLFSCFFCLLLPVDSADVVTYEGFSLLSIPTNETITEAIRRVQIPREMEILNDATIAKGRIDVFVSPTAFDQLRGILAGFGVFDIKVIKEFKNDTIKYVRDDRLLMKSKLSRLEDFSHSEYHSYDEIIEYLNLLENEFPGLVKVFSIGKSVEEREIYAIRIGKERNLTNSPAVILEAGVHAREWIAVSSCLYLIDEARKLLLGFMCTRGNMDIENFTWYIVPSLNPDGYEYSRTTDRMWRKNRKLNNNPNCSGIDLNRNWDLRWEEGNADECSQGFHGSEPFSESEAKALKNLFEGIQSIHARYGVQLYADVHTHGKEIIYPDNPRTIAHSAAVARRAAERVLNETGEKYRFGTVQEIIEYTVFGDTMDWMTEHNVPNSFAFELNDETLAPAEDTLRSGPALVSLMNEMIDSLRKELFGH